MSLRLAALALTLSASFGSGCYFEDQCEDYQGAAEAPATLRNPNSGQCESYYGYGSGGSTCGDYGTPVPQADPVVIPDWGTCEGTCEQLDETACLQAEECRGSYLDTCVMRQDGQSCEFVEITFNECWAITPGGGFAEEGCSTYAADECARHNECSAVHASSDGNGVGGFAYCIDEDAGGEPGTCNGEVLCESVPPECPAGTTPGIGESCWTGYCIPLDECEAEPACELQSEQDCIARADCSATYRGENCTCEGSDCTCADWVYESCSQALAL